MEKGLEGRSGQKGSSGDIPGQIEGSPQECEKC